MSKAAELFLTLPPPIWQDRTLENVGWSCNIETRDCEHPVLAFSLSQNQWADWIYLWPSSSHWWLIVKQLGQQVKNGWK